MSAENIISTAIISQFSEKLIDGLQLDVALVGGGPSALVAARYLAEAGLKTAIFERKLAPGGGTWGGGMLFNEVVVQDEALDILDDFGITHRIDGRRLVAAFLDMDDVVILETSDDM